MTAPIESLAPPESMNMDQLRSLALAKILGEDIQCPQNIDMNEWLTEVKNVQNELNNNPNSEKIKKWTALKEVKELTSEEESVEESIIQSVVEDFKAQCIKAANDVLSFEPQIIGTPKLAETLKTNIEEVMLDGEILIEEPETTETEQAAIEHMIKKLEVMQEVISFCEEIRDLGSNPYESAINNLIDKNFELQDIVQSLNSPTLISLMFNVENVVNEVINRHEAKRKDELYKDGKWVY